MTGVLHSECSQIFGDSVTVIQHTVRKYFSFLQWKNSCFLNNLTQFWQCKLLSLWATGIWGGRFSQIFTDVICCLQKVEEEIRQHWVHVKYADVEKATEKATTGMCQIIMSLKPLPKRNVAIIYRSNIFIPPKDAPLC